MRPDYTEHKDPGDAMPDTKPADYIEAAVIACSAAALDDGWFPIPPKAWALDYSAIEVLARELAAKREARKHD